MNTRRSFVVAALVAVVAGSLLIANWQKRYSMPDLDAVTSVAAVGLFTQVEYKYFPTNKQLELKLYNSKSNQFPDPRILAQQSARKFLGKVSQVSDCETVVVSLIETGGSGMKKEQAFRFSRQEL
jgi:hypothetical protein